MSHNSTDLFLLLRACAYGVVDVVDSMRLKARHRQSALPSDGSLANLSCAITGGNAGVGFETARLLAQRGCKTTILCRNKGRAQEAIKRIYESDERMVNYALLDLNDPKSIEECARSSPHYDILVNNAGVMLPPLTSEGFDPSYQSNYLGHYQFMSALERLGKAPNRICNVSSVTHNGGRAKQCLQPAFYAPSKGRKLSRWDRWSTYCDSKLAITLWTEQLCSKGYRAFALDPGISTSKLGYGFFANHSPLGFLPSSWLQNLCGALFRTPRDSARLM
eukprot:4825676-Pyramimonas_sp.AAC.1